MLNTGSLQDKIKIETADYANPPHNWNLRRRSSLCGVWWLVAVVVASVVVFGLLVGLVTVGWIRCGVWVMLLVVVVVDGGRGCW